MEFSVSEFACKKEYEKAVETMLNDQRLVNISRVRPAVFTHEIISCGKLKTVSILHFSPGEII